MWLGFYTLVDIRVTCENATIRNCIHECMMCTYENSKVKKCNKICFTLSLILLFSYVACDF